MATLVLLVTCVDPVSAEMDYELSLNIENFATMNSINDNSPSILATKLAGLQNGGTNTLFQPRFKGQYDNFQVIALPRLLVTASDVEGEVESDVDSYFQEYTLQYSGEQVSISAGRELLFWGPAINQSPSNPFYLQLTRSTHLSNPAPVISPEFAMPSMKI